MVLTIDNHNRKVYFAIFYYLCIICRKDHFDNFGFIGAFFSMRADEIRPNCTAKERNN